MHGDYQFANVMFRHGAPARMAAVVDWEMGTIGDPKLDLGWLLEGWPEDTAAGDGAITYVDLAGMPGRGELVARYAEVSGRQVDDLDYYVVLARWKLGVVIELGYQRAGEIPTLQAFGPVALALTARAAELAETTDYAVTAG
jgi:aminoglycoside phosphotransferase (APT) family kinase protein